MASRLIRAITALSLAITFYSATSVPSARAAAFASDPAVKLHTIKFYFDPALVPDMAFARTVLTKYVADLNSVLAKNTDRQLVFDPQTGIVLTTTKPQSDSASSPLPTDGFEIWTYARQTTASLSYGGYASIDKSGAGVLAGLSWTRLYDPDTLGSGNVRDYTLQIGSLLHEMAHVFGAGIGEYYNLASITDTTATDPLDNISLTDPADTYWSDKADFLPDPLLRLSPAATRGDYLSAVRYSALTAAIINGDYRNGVPSFGSFTVQVVDKNGQPMPGVEIKVWNVTAGSPFTYASQLLYDVQADSAGQATLLWGGTGRSHNASNMLRLIKVYQNGAALSDARYVSIFDADIAQFVDQQPAVVVTMRQLNHAPTDVSLSNATIDENQPAGTVIGTVTGLDPDLGDALSYSLCGGPDDGSFQLVDGSLQSTASFDYETKKSYSVCLGVSDSFGGTFHKTATVLINDLLDANRTATFPSAAVPDGWIVESAQGSGKGGHANATTATALVGYDGLGREYRSVLSFSTGALPDRAVVTNVILKVKQRAVVGTNPFSTYSRLTADVSKAFIGTTTALQAADFQALTNEDAAASFTSVPDNGWYTAKLDASALALVNVKGPTQFRLRFGPAAGAVDSWLSFYSGNAAAANRPVLIVEYYVP